MDTSLRARITLGLAAVALVFGLVTLVAIRSLTVLGGAVATILEENYRSVIACEDMTEALEREDAAIRFATTGHEEIARPMLLEHRARFADAFAAEARNVTLPGEHDAVQRIDGAHRDYLAVVDRILATSPDSARGMQYFADALPRSTHLRDEIQHVLRLNQARMEAADRETRALARRGIAITWSAAVLALVIAALVAWRVPRMIVRPVKSLADAAGSIGRGELDVTVDDAGMRELTPLTDAFRTMTTQLNAYRASSLGALRDAQDLADSTVRCLLDPVVVIGRGGELLVVNEAAHTTFGLRTGSADDLRRDDVHVPEAFVQARDRVVLTGERVAPRTLAESVRHRDRDYLVRAAPLRGGRDDRGRAVVIAQDVTRLRRIDALKSEMVATVSHEFKTPLTSLRMATHLLLEVTTGPLNDAQREVVTAARDDTERLRTLVDELLDLVRIENEAGELHRSVVDPRAILRSVIDAHRTIARDKGVQLRVESLDDDAGTASLDAEKIAIVLANLVSNAIRHTPGGGTVTLGAHRGGDADTVCLTVRDTGAGITPDDAARLLGRARSAGILPHAGRHGLGLIIAHEIVVQHGGELRAETNAGTGSVFTVTLPRTGDGGAEAMTGG